MTFNCTDEQSHAEILELIQSFRLRLIDKLDGIEPTTLQRLLRIYEVWHQVNLRRTTDLAEGAVRFFEENRLVPACTLTRSIFETVGVQYYIFKKLVAYTNSSDPEAIRKLLLSAVFGRRDKEEWPEKSIQVLTALDHLNKQFPGIRAEYDRLCEYAHPNLCGGYGTYTKSRGDKLEIHFGCNPQNLPMEPWGQGALQAALRVADFVDYSLCSFHHKFVSMVAAQHP
jgi:hypothetical protein